MKIKNHASCRLQLVSALFILLSICPAIHAADTEITITVSVTKGVYTLPVELQKAFICNLKYDKADIKKATKCTLILIVASKNVSLTQGIITLNGQIILEKTELVSAKIKL